MRHCTVRAIPTIALVVAAVFSVNSCDSPTGPKRPVVLSPGAVVQGTIRSLRDTARYVLDLTQGKNAVIYFKSKGELLRLDVHDVNGNPVAATGDGGYPLLPRLRATSQIRASVSRYLVTVSSVLSDSPSDFEIRVVADSKMPEHVPVALAIGTVVTGEDIEHPFDVDSFTVIAPQDQLVTLYLRKTTQNAASIRAAFIQIYGSDNTVTAGPADTVLGGVASGRLALQAGVPQTVLVFSTVLDTASVPYEIQVKAIDRAPESRPAALVPMDTVHESIDFVGDVDEFMLTGAPGAQFNVFVDASGTAPHGVIASVLIDAGFPFQNPQVSAIAGSSPLASNATGVFALPANGQVTISVVDQNDKLGAYRGPYRLLVYPIDPRPEGVPADLVFDQTMTSSIDMLGDVDEYRLTVARDTIVNFIFRGVNASRRSLDLTLLTHGDSVIGVRALSDDYPITVGDSAGFGAWSLQTGVFTIRVAPRKSRLDGYVGRYEILPRTVSTAPESHAVAISVDETVSAERIDFAGDIDRFHVSLNAGDSTYLQVLPVDRDTVALRATLVETATGSSVNGRLLVAPTTGDYYLEFRGATRGIDLSEYGAYAFRLASVGFAPEDRSASFALGDTVRSRIDVPGEVDDFLLTAPAGITLTGVMQWVGNAPVEVVLEFIDPATGTRLDSAHILHESLGHVVMPAGGTMRVRIRELTPGCEPYGCYPKGAQGPYWFVITQLDRGPETGSANYTIGNTVSGEGIFPAGDIDEYTFAAMAGDTVDVNFETPMGTWSGPLTLKLIDLTTGAELGSVSSIYPSGYRENHPIWRVRLPSTGSYQIRVLSDDEHYGKGEYRFSIARFGG